MRRGRPAKPDFLRRLEGDTGKRGQRRPAPAASLSPLPADPPTWLGLTGAEQIEWKQVAPTLTYCGVLDVRLVALYVATIVEYQNMRREVEEVGIVVEGSRGQPMVSPQARRLTLLRRELLTLATEVGATPLARRRHGIPLAEAEPEKDLRMFNGPGR